MAQAQTAQREDVELAFKRFILTESADFASEPAADLFRVNLLGQMLDRYDELLARQVDPKTAQLRVKREFSDIAELMREQDFDIAEEFTASRWPQLSEEDAAQYITESDSALHKKSLGTAMCTACTLPLMFCMGFGEMLGGARATEFMSFLGLAGMFAMIALGVYSICTAGKPKKQETVKRGRFSLSSRVRRKLRQLQTAVDEKARRRKGKGVALLVTCAAPIFVGAAVDSLFYSEFGAMFGVAGMFAMIGLGVYEVMMADGEKKTMKKLLDNER